jgi:hypothetical protein
MQYMQPSSTFARMLCSDCCPVAAVCCCNRHAKYGEAADGVEQTAVATAKPVDGLQEVAGLEQGKVTEGELTLQEVLAEVCPELVVQQEVDEEGDAGPPAQPVLTAAAAASAAYNHGNMFMEYIAQHSDHFSTDEVKAVVKILDKLTAYRQQVSHQMGIAAFLVQPAGGAAAAGGAGSSRLRQAAADVEVHRQGHQMGIAAFFASGAAAAAGAAGNSRLGQAAAGVEVVDLVGDVDKGCVDEEMDGERSGSEGEGDFSADAPSKHGTDGADDDMGPDMDQ